MQNPVSQMYSNTARWLHWLVAGLIVLQYVLAQLAEIAAEEAAALRQLAILAQHKSVGITILVLAMARLMWRWRHPAPALPADMPSWQKTTATFGHWGLYLLLFLLPISGWLMSSASAYSVSWFNLVSLPDLVSANEDLKDLLLAWHTGFARALFVLALIHIGAALKHALIDHDGVLQRMISVPGVIVATGLLAVGIYTTGGRTSEADTHRSETPWAVAEQTQITPAPVSALPLWEIDYAQSVIEFSGEQAGAPFTGRWPAWQAQIHFDGEDLASSRARVTIDATQVMSNDTERDNTIRGPEFFDTIKHPAVTFTATDFSRNANGFSSQAQLTIKQLQLAIPFNFQTTEQDGLVILEGTAQIDRLAFNIGTGDWQDTTWVGQYVDVYVKVTAKR